MYEREALIRRSTPLERAANVKLSENKHKPADWADYSDMRLFEDLRTEIDELEREVTDYGSRSAARRERILREAGDVLNTLRFILDKHGCLGEDR